MDEFLSICRQTSQVLSNLSPKEAALRFLRKNPPLQEQVRKIERQLHMAKEIYRPFHTLPSPGVAMKAVAWNIERGKHLNAVIQTLKNHPALKEADLYFLTEVDWGMARSGNRNVAAEIGEALGLYCYFAPSYYNLTKGHGSERHLAGKNAEGLHGKALLSRFPLSNLQVVKLPNATDKLRSQEARLGEKRALMGSLKIGTETLSLVCTHFDAFSSPETRAAQLKPVLNLCASTSHALIAGDWNTNTLNTTNGLMLTFSVLKQILLTGPQKMIREHHPFPERRFEKPLFDLLRREGFDFERCNEPGVGTYDLVSNDEDLGRMARDQFPQWILEWINRQVEKAGGHISLKLDWFAAKNLKCGKNRVIRLKTGEDYDPKERPSDHHPIVLEFRV